MALTLAEKPALFGPIFRWNATHRVPSVTPESTLPILGKYLVLLDLG